MQYIMPKLYTSSFYASTQQILPLVLAPNRIHALIPPNARFCHNVHLNVCNTSLFIKLEHKLH